MTQDEAGETVLTIGTRKGLFLLRSRDRRDWRVEGPHFPGVAVYDARFGHDGRIFAAVTSEHWGPTVQFSDDGGKSWTPASTPPHFPEASGLSVTRVWSLSEAADGTLYAGVEPAGLFRSHDRGLTWEGVEGFNAQPGRDDWFPGGGGLCLHTILPHPRDPARLLVAASAVGIFESQDAGRTWRLQNGGIRADFAPAGETREDEPGSCPHKLARDAGDPDLVYMQNHCGVYKRHSADASWTDINEGLPSRFGFPMATHPRRPGTAFTVMLEGDFNRVSVGGAFALHRTRDAGKSWTRLSKGLPQEGAWLNVLREGLAVDSGEPAGVYVGTTTGQVFASADEGDTWSLAADRLPQVLSVNAARVQ